MRWAVGARVRRRGGARRRRAGRGARAARRRGRAGGAVQPASRRGAGRGARAARARGRRLARRGLRGGRVLAALEDRLRALPRLVVDHLGLDEEALPVLRRLGCMVKATGFGRVDLDVEATLRALDPDRLTFGTDLPGTAPGGRSSRPTSSSSPRSRRRPWRTTRGRGIDHGHELRHPSRRQVRPDEPGRHPGRARRPRAVVQPDADHRQRRRGAARHHRRRLPLAQARRRGRVLPRARGQAADRLRGPRHGRADAPPRLHGAARRRAPHARARGRTAILMVERAASTPRAIKSSPSGRGNTTQRPAGDVTCPRSSPR